MDELLAALALADFSYRGNQPPTEWMSTMSVATARVELYNLPTSTTTVVDYLWVKARSTGFLSTMLATDSDYPDYTDYATATFGVGSGVWDARMVWNEAHLENDQRKANTLNNERFWEVVEAPVQTRFDAAYTPVPDRKAQAEAMAVMRRRENQQAEMIKNLERRIETLSADITDGADSRLIPFWEQAGENATEAGFCPEYDRMAEMMNGVRRTKTYRVRVARTVTYTEYVTIEVSIPSDPNGTSSRELMRAINEQGLLDGEEDWENGGDFSFGDEEVDDYDVI
jgi:hypothetical protein